jgi:hypothetical protein
MVRNLIGDFADPPKYDDDRITQAIITAGLIATREYEFAYDYTFDFVAATITPDPTDPDTLDNEFIALVALKAACILSLNSYQTAVVGGIKVVDDGSSIDTTSGFKGYSDIIALGPCASYNKLLDTLVSAKSMRGGRAVYSPYSCTDTGYGHFGNWRITDFYNSWAAWGGW